MHSRLGRSLAINFLFLAYALPSQAQLSPPRVCDLYPQDVLPDEPIFITITGNSFRTDTRIRVEGVGDLIDQHVVAEGDLFGCAGIITGYSPTIGPNPDGNSFPLTAYDAVGQTTASTGDGYIIYNRDGQPYLISCQPNEIGPEGGTLIHFYGRSFHEGLVPVFSESNYCTDSH